MPLPIKNNKMNPAALQLQQQQPRAGGKAPVSQTGRRVVRVARRSLVVKAAGDVPAGEKMSPRTAGSRIERARFLPVMCALCGRRSGQKRESEGMVTRRRLGRSLSSGPEARRQHPARG